VLRGDRFQKAIEQRRLRGLDLAQHRLLLAREAAAMGLLEHIAPQQGMAHDVTTNDGLEAHAAARRAPRLDERRLRRRPRQELVALDAAQARLQGRRDCGTQPDDQLRVAVGDRVGHRLAHPLEDRPLNLALAHTQPSHHGRAHRLKRARPALTAAH
jgi:hypothetical protein